MKNQPLVLLAFLLVLPTETVVAQVVGDCIAVETLGEWYPVESTVSDPNLRVPPPRDDYYGNAFPALVELGAERSDATWSVLIIPESSQQTPHSYRLWRQAGDTLIVRLSTGYHGVVARLLRNEKSWNGTLRNFTDALGTLLYERSISLSTWECDLPTPISADEDPPLPRMIELQDGQRFELGSPLPQGVATESRRLGGFTVLSRTVGRFAGADTVIVWLDATSRIAMITVRFPQEFDFGGLIARMGSEFEPPRSGSVGSWSNRTTRVTSSPGSTGRAHRIILVDPRLRLAG